MDVRCVRCGEPWDNDCIHDEVQERFADTERMRAYNDSGPFKDQKLYEPMYKEVAADFRNIGCAALTSYVGENYVCSGQRDIYAEAAYIVNGDDMDGAAADMEDWL